MSGSQLRVAEGQLQCNILPCLTRDHAICCWRIVFSFTKKGTMDTVHWEKVFQRTQKSWQLRDLPRPFGKVSVGMITASVWQSPGTQVTRVLVTNSTPPAPNRFGNPLGPPAWPLPEVHWTDLPLEGWSMILAASLLIIDG